MNTEILKKMYSGINKVSLSEMKVDLALVDDIQKMLDSVTKERDLIRTIVDKIASTSTELKNVDAQIKTMEKALQDTKTTQGKTLGKTIITLQNQVDKEYKAGDALENKSYALIQKAQAAADALGVDAMAIKGLKELDNTTNDLESWRDQMNIDVKKIPFPDFLQF